MRIKKYTIIFLTLCLLWALGSGIATTTLASESTKTADQVDWNFHSIVDVNFVMEQALEGGVNESLNLDSHGKSWSFLVLDLEVDVDP